MQFSGKTALRTGATGGLGTATARALALRGAKVVVCSRKQAELERSASRCRGRATAPSSPSSAKKAPARGSPPRAEAAGRSTSSSPTPACPAAAASRSSARDITRVLRVNLEAPIRASRALLPACSGAARAISSTSPRSPARSRRRGLAVQRHQVRPARLRPRAAPGPARARRRRLARAARLHPRRGDVRRRRHEAAAGDGHEHAGEGRRGSPPAWVETEQGRVVVAHPQARAGSALGSSFPSICCRLPARCRRADRRGARLEADREALMRRRFLRLEAGIRGRRRERVHEGEPNGFR